MLCSKLHCQVTMRGITLVVEEGSLTHHALEVDKGILHMDTCDISGGLYGNPLRLTCTGYDKPPPRRL